MPSPVSSSIHLFRTLSGARSLPRILIRTFAMAPNQSIPPLSDKSLFKQECYVNGEWTKAKSGKTFEVKDPGSGKLIGTCPECSKEDTDEAIRIAAAAFPSFRKTTGRERARMLRKWYQLMVDNADDIAKLITWENGKPFADAKGEAAYAASFFEWFSEEAPRADGDTIPATVPGNRVFTIKEPVGVCGLITPWNFPAAMITRKIGPALAAGCTVVAKSPGETPFTSLALAELAHRAGIPKGVVNFITALDNTAEVGSALTSNPTIRKVSFTGSTGVGKLLMKQSADTLKKLSFELGGNAPFIVFDDADLDLAVNGAIACKFRSSGQTCVCANRIYVQKGIYDKFATSFVEKVKGFKVGGGYDEGVTHGPLIHDRAVSKVDAHVRDAQKNGGKVVVGGQKMPDLGSNFFQPTVIMGMTMDMQLASEETFGPVAGLFPFETEAEVVEMANKAEVGLAGYFYSKDLQRAYRVAEALEVGMVGINTGLVSDPAAPFGGVKYSGFGREGSKYGIAEYQITKMITMGGMGEPLQDDLLSARPQYAMSRLDTSQTAPASISLQTFASPTPSHARNSSLETNGSLGRWGPDDLARPQEFTAGLSQTSREMNEDHVRQRQKARGSAGFLLQDTVPTYVHRTGKKPLPQVTSGSNGKERTMNGDFHPIHKRTPAGRHRHRTSLGSSPLSTVIYNDTRVVGTSDLQSSNVDQISPNQYEPSERRLSDRNRPSISDEQVVLQERGPQTQIPSAIGYNTDPAQIVNLALNLSESRRRNVSGGRISPAYISGTRRQVSSEASMSGFPVRYVSAAGAHLRRHLDDQRRISRTSTPRSDTQSWESPSPRSMRSSNGGDSSTSSALYELQTAEEVILKPSDATLARAEKARVVLELSYEYRKLLQHLPKLPISTHNRPTTSKSGNAPNVATSENLGRAYDPLQYIRNRKVRGRERKHLDAEAEGWKDLDRVRLWIDRIADAQKAQAPSPEHGYTLPPFDLVQSDSPVAQGSPKSSAPISTTTRLTKSERQSSGWGFTPWDMLADAAWLSRDDNIRLIEDAKGRKLLPVRQLPKQSTPRASLEQARPSGKRSLSLGRPTAPEELSAPESSTKTKHKRNLSHTRGRSDGAKSPLRDHESPRDRKGRWRRNFGRSRDPSSSEGSLTDGANRYAWSSHHDREGLDSVALEKQMMELLAKEIDDDPFARPTEGKPVKEGSLDGHREAAGEEVKRKSYVKQPDIRKTPKRTAPQPQPVSVGSVEDQRGRRPLSFHDLDDTAPNSPSSFHFGPSIFINHSAPNSRSVSPKKLLPSRLRPSLRNRSNSRRSVSDHDVAVHPVSPVRSGSQHATDVNPKSSHSQLQKSDSSNNLLSPITAELLGKRFRRLNDSSASIKAGKESRDPESRFRTLLKGGRIAELVGNEVSRVGDMIWRRDGNNPPSSPSLISARPMGDSDTEGEYSTLENSPETDLSRVTTNNDDGGNLSRVSTKSGQPRYHHQNLPTFRSSTSQICVGSPNAASPEDHPITRQQMAQKARGRSSKFERLAPPKIDLRNISPSASPPLSRTQTNDGNDRSRDPSSSRSTHRVRSADRRLNDVLGIPGTIHNAVAPTGLTNLSSKSTKHRSRDRSWSISRSVSNTRSGTVTKRDIARVRALLLSSGIKANEIARQAYSIDDPPFLPQLRELHQRSEKPIPRVSRAQEHLLTAKLIVAEIDAMNQQLRDQAEAFSNETVARLHQKFTEMDERVSTTLVPQVRASADEADALSMELTTTHTLSVKRVGDAVEALLRKRRRRG
ncbi:MAG: hypothetical protein Q9210_005888, partial [Variospora velana]